MSTYNPLEFKKGLRTLAKRSPELKALVERHKLEFSPRLERPPYESLVRAIAHQQLHGKAAETILNRMLQIFAGEPFPSAEALHQLEADKLRMCGFSQSKTRAIQDIALKTIEGIVPSHEEIHHLPSEEIIKRLTQIFGVGQWTVEMLLIFQLGRLNVWPVDDFGVRKGFQVWKRKRKMPTAKELRKEAKHFTPYESIGALLMWREADKAKEAPKKKVKKKITVKAKKRRPSR